MKKWIIWSVAALVVMAVVLYYFIPGVNEFSISGYAGCNAGGAFRKVSQQRSWGAWWPGEVGKSASGRIIYRVGGNEYKVRGSAYPQIDVSIVHEGEEVHSRMSFSALGNYDSTAIFWQLAFPATETRIGRWKRFSLTSDLRSDMENILSHLKGYLANSEHIYDMVIQESSTKDTFLIATKSLFGVYPTTTDIYGMLGRLRNYARKAGALESGYPMVNVNKVDSGFQVMAALPIDRALEGEGNIFYRRLVPGKFLVGEVKGGAGSIEAGLERLRQYISDHNRTVMAIPFQSLITDRMQVQDTSQWRTQLYYPVF